jgi:hypothetical protein
MKQSQWFCHHEREAFCGEQLLQGIQRLPEECLPLISELEKHTCDPAQNG